MVQWSKSGVVALTRSLNPQEMAALCGLRSCTASSSHGSNPPSVTVASTRSGFARERTAKTARIEEPAALGILNM